MRRPADPEPYQRPVAVVGVLEAERPRTHPSPDRCRALRTPSPFSGSRAGRTRRRSRRRWGTAARSRAQGCRSRRSGIAEGPGQGPSARVRWEAQDRRLRVKIDIRPYYRRKSVGNGGSGRRVLILGWRLLGRTRAAGPDSDPRGRQPDRGAGGATGNGSLARRRSRAEAAATAVASSGWATRDRPNRYAASRMPMISSASGLRLTSKSSTTATATPPICSAPAVRRDPIRVCRRHAPSRRGTG